ncbi:hypothetical protein [Micromonospora cremea]|uniref:hypothetical protein n=1 Tax=Micromonospora cremea TaxID=709881 RepID=UPI001FCCB0F8|nr:hypothetical protein [Micromonospora cremea]
MTILIGDPTSEAIERKSVEEGAPGVMAAKIRQVQQYYKRLDGAPGVKVRYHDTTLYNSIYRFDDEMLVNMHVLGFPAPHAPVMHLRRLNGGDLFGTYADSFDRVLAVSAIQPRGEVAARQRPVVAARWRPGDRRVGRRDGSPGDSRGDRH